MAQLEDLRVEYQQANSNFRLLSTFRLGELSFFIGFTGTMINFMWTVYGGTTSALRIFLPLGGAIGTFLIYNLDRRLLRLYDALIGHMVTLENYLGLRDGMYRLLRSLTTGPRVRRVSGIGFLVVFLLFFGAVIPELVRLIPVLKEVLYGRG